MFLTRLAGLILIGMIMAIGITCGGMTTWLPGAANQWGRTTDSA